MKIPRLVVLLMLVVFASPSVAGFCKWVDENGVTHYAETCPEDVDSAEVETHATPTQEQVDAAIKRSGQSLEKRKVQKEFEQQQAEKNILEKQALEVDNSAMREICVKASVNHAVLNMALPVYYDEEGFLHHNRGIHFLWYEGAKTFIDDEERPAKIQHYNQQIADNCIQSKSEIKKQIEMLRELFIQWICMGWKNDLNAMKKANTGIPSTPMRELDKLIKENCN